MANILKYNQSIYERFTGIKHIVQILFTGRRCYEVRFDDEFYATAENMARALDEVVDILAEPGYTTIRPI